MTTTGPPTHIDVSNTKWSIPQTLTDSPHSSSSSHSSLRPSSPISLQHRQYTSDIISPPSSQITFSLQGISTSTSISPTSLSSTTKRKSPTNDDEVSIDPYKILGVPRDGTNDNIVSSYRRLALLSHPRRSTSCIERRQNYYSDVDHSAINEESIREWHFIVVAASYETLSVPEHRHEYDLIWRRIQSGLFKEKSDVDNDSKKGFWLTLRKGIDVNDSFDVNKVENPECCGNGCGNNIGFMNLCGANNVIYEDSEMVENNEKNDLVTKLQLTRGGKKLMSNCKPMKMSESHRGKSTATEGSTATDEENYEFFREETSNLFGGPLLPLYRARQYQPFTDAYELFKREFGSDIFRSRSCFDEDDENNNPIDLDEQSSKQWLSGGTGRLLNESIIASPSPTNTKNICKNDALVYPVLPNIPQSLLKKYGILNGTIRCIDRKDNAKNMKKSNISTKIKREKQDGILSEVKTTTKIQGNMRIIRTETTKIDKSTGSKKTFTTVKREVIPMEEQNKFNEQATTNKCTNLLDMVPCCSFPTPNSPQSQNPPSLMKSIDDESTLSTQSSYLSIKNFNDKNTLRRKMQNLSINQNRESREDEHKNIDFKSYK